MDFLCLDLSSEAVSCVIDHTFAIGMSDLGGGGGGVLQLCFLNLFLI